MLSVEPAPVVIVLPNWSSTVTPTVKLVPVATDAGGWVVMASLFSAPATMVKPFVVPLTRTVLTVAEAEIVGAPALVSE